MGRSSLKFIGVCIEHAQLDSSPTCLITPQGFSQTDEQRSSPQRPKQRLALRVVPCHVHPTGRNYMQMRVGCFLWGNLLASEMFA
ncbi:hypothetical protein R3I93_002774 [Phoxinus phoxinus]|uniref:Uncharacterized protein n=1 Tax=Phoxinus phoxinus TaxID=58324 RepID=A0AAN9DLH3_9TELE